MAARIQQGLARVCATALLVALVGGAPQPVSAANLTGGTYTYVVNGEESNFVFDPIKVKDGLLVPVEVYQRFGVSAKETGKSIVLRKAEVEAKLTLGSNAVLLNEDPEVVAAEPLRLNGRIFLPADLLKFFGVELSLDGNLIVLEDYGEGMEPTVDVPEAEYRAMRSGRTFTEAIKADSETSLQAEFMLLTPDLASSANLTLRYGARARIQRLEQTNTLVWVRLHNMSFRSGSLVTSGLYLVDQNHKQYPLVTTLDTGEGPIHGDLVPSAERVGVLVFPKAATKAVQLSLYYEPNATTLGVFTNIR